MGASQSTIVVYEYQVGQRVSFMSDHGFALNGTIMSKEGYGPGAVYGFLQDQGTHARRVHAHKLSPMPVLPPGATVVYQTSTQSSTTSSTYPPYPPQYAPAGPYPPAGYPQAAYPPAGYPQAYPPAMPPPYAQQPPPYNPSPASK